MKTNTRKLSAILLAVILVCSLSAGYAYAANNSATLSFAAAGRTPGNAAEVYANNVNSTVAIKSTKVTNMFGYETVSGSSGSGFILTEDGYILTNNHVVSNAEKISVQTYGGETYNAELIGYETNHDIAVLKIEASGLTPVTFGNSDELVVGEEVLAIGNPLGELDFSLTHGVVSALDRDLNFSGTGSLKLIQTDCAINSGSSGGALFNMYGEVVGITYAKASGNSFGSTIENITFAIPVSTVVDIVEQIMTTGEIATPYIGISINDVNETLLAYGVPKGANIVSVTEDSPAEKAGLQENDVVVAANGDEITSSDDLVQLIRSCKVGEKVELSVYRQGKTIELIVTVGENVKSALPVSDAKPEK